MRRLKFWFIFVSIFLWQIISPVFAASAITRDEKIQLFINSDATALVKINRTVSLQGASWLVLPARGNKEVFSICAPVANVKDKLTKKMIAVSWNRMPVTDFYLERKEHCYLVHVPYLESLNSYSKAYISVSFKTTMFSKRVGGVLEVLYPGFSKTTKFKSTVKTQVGSIVRYYKPSVEIIIPRDLGPISGAVPSSNYKVVRNRYVFNYSSKDLIGQSVRITIGNKRLVFFRIETRVKKTNVKVPGFFSRYVSNQVDLVLPRTDSLYGQSVVFTRLSPLPDKIWQDAEGNLWATFRLDVTKDSRIVVEGLATINQRKMDLGVCKSATLENIMPQKSLLKYTEASLPFWDSTNSIIQNAAKSLLDKERNFYKTLENDIRFVVDKLEYQRGTGFSNVGRKGAVNALISGKGVCMEFADLLITLLRAQNIPARAAVGNAVGYLIDDASRIYGHQWVEVYCPGGGWIPVDPTWSTSKSLVVGPDLDHFFHYRVADSNNFSTMLCKTYDIASKGPICQDYNLTVQEINQVPPTTNMYIPAEGLKNYVKSRAQKRGKVDMFIKELGASPVGRVLFTVPGVYFLFAGALFLLVNIIGGIWKILFPRKSQDMY